MRRRQLLALAAAIPTAGCAQLASILNHADKYANWVEAAVDAIERLVDGADLSEANRETAHKAVEATRRSLRLLHHATTAANAEQAGDMQATERAVVEAYRELHSIVATFGLLPEGGPDGGPDGDIPTPEELEARL